MSMEEDKAVTVHFYPEYQRLALLRFSLSLGVYDAPFKQNPITISEYLLIDAVPDR